MKMLKMADGKKMPAVGLGTWQLTGDICFSAVKTALEMGYKHIDTAEIYGNHKEVGKAISGHDRSGLFITSKVWRSDMNYDNILRACDRTLGEIGTEYLVLYLLHWPNDSIPMEESMKGLNRLVDENKVRSIGLSNFNEKKTDEAMSHTDIPIVTNQVEFHPYLFQKELLEYSAKKNIILTAYSPNAMGRVSKDEAMTEIGARYGKTSAQVGLRWLLQHGLAVIPRSSGSHLKENIDLFDFSLKRKEMDAVDSLNINKRLMNPSFSSIPFFDSIPEPVIKFASKFLK